MMYSECVKLFYVIHPNHIWGDNGGVVFFIREDLHSEYHVDVIDDSVEEILWIRMSNTRDRILCVSTSSPPPEKKTKKNRQDKFTVIDSIVTY